MKKYILFACVVGCLLAASSVHASEKDWSMEIVPYMWFAGIDGDVSVRGRDVDVDVGFDDLLDRTELAASAVIVAEFRRFLVWSQFDYFSLSSDQADAEDRVLPGGVSLDSDMGIAEVAFGYRFDGWMDDQTIDVLVGVRYTRLENDLHIDGVGSFSSDKDLTDPILVLRPNIALFPSSIKGLSFNPTLAIGGGGDSELIYELQPQIQYHFTPHVAGRVGYRRVYYDIEGNNGNEFDAAIHGFILGVSFMF